MKFSTARIHVSSEIVFNFGKIYVNVILFESFSRFEAQLMFVKFPDYCQLPMRSLLPDVNECLDSPCLNQGTCENVPGSYNCRCVAEWEGPNCETGKFAYS